MHSLQSSHCTATRLRYLLGQHGAQQSMRRRGMATATTTYRKIPLEFQTELLDSGSFPLLNLGQIQTQPIQCQLQG